jgi:anti-sigma regulatory factor (Ser/Thr protein kinase)
MNKIIMPPHIDEVEIEEIIAELKLSSFSTHLDFSKIEFISPFASILLLQLLEKIITKSGRKIHIILGKPVKPCFYVLARLGFFENLPKEVTFYPYKPKPKGNPRGKNDAILEITRIQEKSAGEIINKVDKAIAINTDYPIEQKYDICIMVSEMIQNIFYHSEAPKSGLIAIQNFEKLDYMQMIIADSGIGIPETLRRCAEYKNSNLQDFETILEAVKKGVSGMGKEENRGEGLSTCVDLANKHKATLYIKSNNGFARLTFKKNKKSLGTSSFLTGTQIFVNFPCK